MTKCSTNNCPNVLTKNTKLTTCASCRANIHSWEKRPTGEIVRRAMNLQKYTSRMETFAVVKDEQLTLKSREELMANRVAIFRNKRKARSNVVAFKLRNRSRA